MWRGAAEEPVPGRVSENSSESRSPDRPLLRRCVLGVQGRRKAPGRGSCWGAGRTRGPWAGEEEEPWESGGRGRGRTGLADLLKGRKQAH